MSQSQLSQIAKAIASDTVTLETYYTKHGLPLPSFEVDAEVDTTIHDDDSAEQARIKVIENSTILRDLLEGPTMQLRPVLNATSLQAIYRYDLPSKVPLGPDADISYEELAQQCGLDSGIVRRIIRFAIAHHRIFQEKRQGCVSHSAASKLLASSPDAMSGVGMMFDECYQAFAHTVEALQKYDRQTPFQCGFTMAHQSSAPIWEFHAKDPKLTTRTTQAMRQFTRGFGHDTFSLLNGWDWDSLDAAGGLVVDLGGANGHASVLLAQRHPNLRFEVQDLPHVIAAAADDIPTELKDRVSLRSHDFKQPQQTKADVFLLRQVLHDWPDAECVKILQALIPALRPGARVIVNDYLVSPPGVVSAHVERHIRAIDMIVLSLAGSKEREKSDWDKVFQEADPRFTNIKAVQPTASCLAMIEATWSG